MSTMTTLAARARQRLTSGALPRWLGAAVTVALAAAGVQAVGASPALAAVAGPGGAPSEASAPAPVSNAFAMGGGVGGSIDQRTGAFQVQVPLVSIAGRAGTGLSLALSYDQSLAVQGTDRFGLGAGWTLGVPWVDTAGGIHVYPASGGSYAYDTGSPTGLAQYPLRDLKFARDPGTTTARPGAAAQPYEYTLTYLDGTVDRFNADGNLVERTDRFGNPIDLTWQQSGQRWLLTSVTDNYGQVTTFDYGTPSQVKIIAPVNAEKITAATTLTFYAGQLQTVTDPLSQKTSFGYSPVGGLPAALLSSVTSPTGERTSVTYTQLPYEQSVVEASDVKVTDPKGVQVLAERRFTLDPADDVSQHNYTGYPLYNTKGPNALFTSGDFGYRYTTELSDGTSAVESTYNSLHLLVSQKVLTAGSGGVLRTSQTQAYTYPPVTSVAALPPNYAQPTSVAVTYGDPAVGSGATRTVTTGSAYNDQGEQTSATNAAGTTTATTYNTYGLPATQTVTGKGGATSVTTDTFTDDGKEVKTATTAVGSSAATATARTVASYDYNGSGQVTGENVAWAPGAKPPGDSGGPNQVDTTQQISVDPAAHTQTDVLTTAAGTPDAASTTTVTDLVTGETLAQTSPGDLTTSYTYDALGRPLTMTAPGDQITKTAYESPTVTTVTAPNGLETQTTTDVLGRTVKVSDNVSGEKLVPNDPTARTLQTDTYNPAGTQLTTTTAAGTTTTTFDPLGRPVQIVQPGGITQDDSYNDVANTQAVALLPADAQPAGAVSVTTEGFNGLNQPVSSSTSYPDGTPQAPAAESYDGLGRVASYTADNVTATPSYTGAGGEQDGTTLTPGDTAAFPGQPAQATTGNTMTGELTAKTLTGQAAGQTKAAGQPAAGTTYAYDAAGRVRTATTADGAVTSYTYTPAGQVATVTQPSGTKTTYTYGAKTGRLDWVDVVAADGRTEGTGYRYDPATGRVASVFNAADPTDAIGYEYDADGHLVEVDYPDGTATKASYEDNGQLASITDVTGAVTSYTYNPHAGTPDGCGPAVTDLCQAVQTRGGTTLASVAYTYDSLDRVHTITRGNGVTTTVGYTDASQVKTETTTAADGSLLRADSYTYDSHGNAATHTITTAPPSPTGAGHAAAARARVRGAAATATTTTTAYRYDAYNRLISSAVYPSATATGTPVSTTAYTLDAAGNVTGQDTTTSAGTTRIVNTITPGGELTARTAGGTATAQKFDADGNVTQDLAGNTYTYDPDGQIASVTTPAGVTTRYTYWPDHTRRTATTTVDGVAHTITYHYATNGKIANETYAGGGPAVTASYLLAVNREARTLATTTATGTVQATGPGTVQATGPGTGYYLTDAHGSVVAMVDNTGQVTAAYAYGDYGQPDGTSPALLPIPAATPAGNAAVNPFTYDDAYTNPTTGTQYLPARTYDPAQGRFLSADAASTFNRYQAFDTNPITDTDPTGQWAIPQILTDAFAALVFVATAVASAGAAIPVFAAAAASEAIGAAAITGAVVNSLAFAANIGAAATSITLTANDAAELTGNGFLSDTQKEDLTTATYALGDIGGLLSAAPGIADSLSEAGTAADAATAADPYSGVPPPTDTPPPPNFLTAAEESSLTSGASQLSGLLSDVPSEESLSWGFGSPTDQAPEAAQGQLPLVSSPDSSTQDVTQLVPPPVDPATEEFTATAQRVAGQDANQNPPDEAFDQVEEVPRGEIDTATAPTGISPSDDATPVGSGTAEVITSTLQNNMDANTGGGTPVQPANPLGENTPPPTIGLAQEVSQAVLTSVFGMSGGF